MLVQVILICSSIRYKLARLVCGMFTVCCALAIKASLCKKKITIFDNTFEDKLLYNISCVKVILLFYFLNVNYSAFSIKMPLRNMSDQ